MKPAFEPTRSGFEIVDPVERCRYPLATPESVAPTPVPTDRVPYPVDAAVELTTTALALPMITTVLVWDPDGAMLTEVRPDERTTLSPDEYALDVSGPIKVYVVVDGGVTISSDADRTHLELDGPTRTIVGARSHHTRPAETVTTTAEPTDVMRAVSTFGSALKTTRPERSYPTMRGHPPALEVGDELDVPPELDRPETGVRLEVPRRLDRVFEVAPLAYYLGADVVPGATPRLVTDRGYTASLGEEEGFETAVERTLKHVFCLDCILRTEGPTSLPLSERRAIDRELDLDLAALYERSNSERLETYLELPRSAVVPSGPEWRLEARIRPTTDRIPFLPFVANDLAIVGTRDGSENATVSVAGRNTDDSVGASTHVRSTARTADSRPRSVTPTIEQSWSSDGGATIESETPLAAYTNGITQTPKAGPIEIEVVCNEPEMRTELVDVYGTYGDRDELSFDIAFHDDLTTAELATVLTGDSDFVHYIGHIDGDGFRCSNGRLDAATLTDVGTKSFFLNACQSADQGIRLIEAGSVGGIVTFDEIRNRDAVDAGRTIARLLDRGYSLYAAVDLLRRETAIGERYRIVGDGLTTVAQPKGGLPNACTVTRIDGELRMTIHEYISGIRFNGAVSLPFVESIDAYHLVPKTIGPFSVTKSELVRFLEWEPIPVFLDGEFRWSDELRLREL